MKKFIIIFIIIFLVVLGIFLSPYYTLYQIKSAYDAKEYPKVIAYMELPKIQQHTKDTLMNRLDKTIKQGTVAELIKLLPNDNFDKILNKTKNDIEKVVDNAITSDNLTKTLSGEITDHSQKFLVVWAMASNYVDYQQLTKDLILKDKETAFKNQQIAIKEQIITRFGKNTPTKTKMHYCGLHCFEITGAVSGVPIGATMSRVSVIGWKVDKIELP